VHNSVTTEIYISKSTTSVKENQRAFHTRRIGEFPHPQSDVNFYIRGRQKNTEVGLFAIVINNIVTNPLLKLKNS